jgi:hypothetical protein
MARKKATKKPVSDSESSSSSSSSDSESESSPSPKIIKKKTTGKTKERKARAASRANVLLKRSEYARFSKFILPHKAVHRVAKSILDNTIHPLCGNDKFKISSDGLYILHRYAEQTVGGLITSAVNIGRSVAKMETLTSGAMEAAVSTARTPYSSRMIPVDPEVSTKK